MVSRARSTVARVGRRASNAIQQFSNAVLPETLVVSREVKVKLAIPKDTLDAYREFRMKASDDMKTRLATRNSHMASMLHETNVEHHFYQFENDFNAQRSQISLDVRPRFDKLWHIDTEEEAFSDIRIKHMLCFTKTQNVIPFLQQEMITVKELAKTSYDQLNSLPDSDAGILLLQLFVIDILGRNTVGSKIFSSKAESDFERNQIVSYKTKIFVLVVLLCINAFCIYYTMLKGYVKGYEWQKQYAIGCTIQLITEITFFETLECIWMNFCLPSIAMHELKRVHKVLDKAINTTLKLLETNNNIPPPPLNVPEYFFVSNIVAHKLPSLPESLIILSYRTCLPGSILHEDKHFEHKQCNMILYIFSIFVSIFVGMIALIPFEWQRGLLRFFEPFLLGGIILGFVYIKSNPIFLSIFCFICLLIIIGGTYWYFKGKNVIKVEIESVDFDEENQNMPLRDVNVVIWNNINKNDSNDNDSSNIDYSSNSDLESIFEMQRKLAVEMLGNDIMKGNDMDELDYEVNKFRECNSTNYYSQGQSQADENESNESCDRKPQDNYDDTVRSIGFNVEELPNNFDASVYE